ncbi:E3 ubiquitin-protein ligase tom1, partial [Coemansia aciculifera]
MDTIAAARNAGGGGQGGSGAARRLNGLPVLGRLGRPLGGLNGGGSSGNPLLVRNGQDGLLDLSMPRLTGLNWSRLGGGGGGGGAHGPSMLHPLVDRGSAGPDRGDALQSRAERVTRSELRGPLRTTPDDVFGLGQALANQLSQFHSGGRRPAYTHHMIPGASSQREPRAWLDSGSSSSSEPVAAGVYGSSHVVLAQLVRMCRAVAAIEAFTPLATPERWQEEARMQPRASPNAYTMRIGAPILNRLVPEAIRQNLLRQRYQVERRRRLAEVDMQQRIEREAKEREESEAAAKKAQEEEEAAEAEEDDDEMEGHQSEGSNQENEAAEEAPAAPAAPAEPVFVVIDGERIDITDTGIDPEFLLALPDDLRMEVIEGRREEQRAEQQRQQSGGEREGAQASAAATDGGISQEFLDALPPEIRAEVLEQERIQRQLLDRDEMLRHMGRRTGAAAAGTGAASSSDDIAGGGTPTQAAAIESVIRDRMRIGMPGPSGSAGGGRWSFLQPPPPPPPPPAALAGSNGAGSSSAEALRLREKRRKKIASRDVG